MNNNLINLDGYFFWRKQARKYEELSRRVLSLDKQIEWVKEASKCEDRAKDCLRMAKAMDKLGDKVS